MHRTNWTAAQTQVNLPVPAVRTRHSRVPLIWTVPDRIALMQRNTAIFGKEHRDALGGPWVHRRRL